MGGSRSPEAATLCGCVDARLVGVSPGENITAQMHGWLSAWLVGVFLGRENNRAGARFGGCFPGREHGCADVRG